MVQSRLGLKVLGLCALALGLMAFVASAAQAEVNARWKVAGVAVTGAEEKQLEIKELEGNTATLEFTTLGGTLVKILCTAAKFGGATGGRLIKEGGISLGDVLFTGCKTELNSKPASGCQTHSPGKAAGIILSENATGLIQLDVVGGKTEEYTKITPDGGPFAKIEMGEECSIGELVEVKGILWIKDCKGNGSSTTAGFLHEEATHLIEESLHLLTALGRPAVIEGSAIVGLTSGALWSGTPG